VTASVRPGASSLLFAGGTVLATNRLIAPRLAMPIRAALDEAAHVSTAVLGLDLLRRREPIYVRHAVAAAVLIDVDHLPEILTGWSGLSKGSPRPYTHCLPLILAVLAYADLGPSHRRQRARGVAFGLATHLLRDITDSSPGAPIFWPLTKRAIRLSPRLQHPLVLVPLCAHMLRCRRSRPPVTEGVLQPLRSAHRGASAAGD
jgi:inner membrane protein